MRRDCRGGFSERRGIRFDEIAILLRSPQQCGLGVLEHALARAKIPAYFDRGIRRPHPAGRAFLAMLSCASENSSAKRFAEYLSLGQVPSLGRAENAEASDSWVPSTTKAFGVLSSRSRTKTRTSAMWTRAIEDGRTVQADNAAILAGTLRAPWKWEALLVESAVIGGSDTMDPALGRLAEEYRLRILRVDGRRSGSTPHPALRARAAESRSPARVRAAAGGGHIRVARRGDLGRLAEAPRGLRAAHPAKPEHVLRVLGRLAADGCNGPVSLTGSHATSLPIGCCRSKWSRPRIDMVGCSSAVHIRREAVPSKSCSCRAWLSVCFRRSFAEDPSLLDDLRRELGGSIGCGPTDGSLSLRSDRAEHNGFCCVWRSGLRLITSMHPSRASSRLKRVPRTSFYALEVMRAVTGRVPDHQTLERTAAHESRASLAWPAPPDAADAIDDFEHDLAVLRD